jgi:hypothetical protein
LASTQKMGATPSDTRVHISLGRRVVQSCPVNYKLKVQFLVQYFLIRDVHTFAGTWEGIWMQALYRTLRYKRGGLLLRRLLRWCDIEWGALRTHSSTSSKGCWCMLSIQLNLSYFRNFYLLFCWHAVYQYELCLKSEENVMLLNIKRSNTGVPLKLIEFQCKLYFIFYHIFQKSLLINTHHPTKCTIKLP